MSAPPRSNFVTIMAWLSLGLAAMGVAGGLLQGAMFLIMRPDRSLSDAFAAAGPGLGLPPAMSWLFDHMGLLLLLSVLSSVLMAVVSWGVLQRREWGRLGFIGLLIAGALLTFAGAFVLDRTMDWVNAHAGVDPADLDPLLASVQASMRIATYGVAALIGVLHGAIVWKLCTPGVRTEFR